MSETSIDDDDFSMVDIPLARASEASLEKRQSLADISADHPPRDEQMERLSWELIGDTNYLNSNINDAEEQDEEGESESFDSENLNLCGVASSKLKEILRRKRLSRSKAHGSTEDLESCVCSEDLSVLMEQADPGVIDLAFPENPECELIAKLCLPPSYYTLSGKERLLLLFAENFRKQFQFHYPKRRPLVLAVRNECDVVKLVCTTIRPTGFVFTELIGSLRNISSFVADFIIYEELPNPISLPPRLISPDMLLRTRHGNCFEMATLLCSMLIGAGFPALVVSGIARRDITKNDVRNVECPFKPKPIDLDDEDADEVPVDTSKYALREPPDLKSHLEEELAKIEAQKELKKARAQEAEIRAKREAEEKDLGDHLCGRRTHAWVVVIENAPWSVQTKKTNFNEDGEEVEGPQTAFFIEPASGFRYDVNFSGYVRIESIWNNYNYYVNRQECPIKEMYWDVGNAEHWEYFLPGEPPELRVEKKISEEEANLADMKPLLEKHLDMSPSWVQKLHISLQQFDERYPNLKKAIHYKRALYERYSPYHQRDGKVSQLTLYEDDNYRMPIQRWDHYSNRLDFLDNIFIDFKEKKIQETFKKGRPDMLKFFEHTPDPKKPSFLHFYHVPRLDSLYLWEVYQDKMILHFKNQQNFCSYLEFRFNKSFSLLHIYTKYKRNVQLPASKDIASQHFDTRGKRIHLQFQYEPGAVTASSRHFVKPPKPDYGQEVIFDPAGTRGYVANPLEAQPTQLELYLLLLDQLKAEEELEKEYNRRVDEMNEMLNKRKEEMRCPFLKFSIFDPLRNRAARTLRLKELEDDKKQRRAILLKDPDFLAAYLVPYKGRSLTTEESEKAFIACLEDLKTRYIRLLNELQRKYEDLTEEAKALKRFLDKFHDQFGDFDYENLLKEKKDIELNKRMVQQRLNLTHEEAQRKYQKVKESLLNDIRLNLDPNIESKMRFHPVPFPHNSSMST